MTGDALSPLLDDIDLVVFDKDGTLLDFHAMWGGWTLELGRRLDASTGRPVSGDVFAGLGFDPTTERVRPGAPLAVATMGETQEIVAAIIRRWCPSVAAARRAVAAAWFVPDPVATAHPTADLRALFERLRDSGRKIAVATSDDHDPTDATLRGIGVRDLVSALVGGDDGVGVKPEPEMLLAICAAVGIPPARTMVVGDAPADLAMGQSAGAGRLVGVLSGVSASGDLGDLADAVIESIADLLVPEPASGA